MNELAVVTGATAGIGKVIAEALLAKGCAVAVTYPPSADGEPADVPAVEGARAYACDAGDEAQVEVFFAEVQKDFGKAPSLIINNAGIQTWSSLLDLKTEDWDRVMHTNLRGCFLNTRIGAKAMIDAGVTSGAIVNLGSGCNKLAFPKLVDYTASKGGIEQFTKVSALELGPHGIRVNCVAPGAIETARTRQEAGDYAGKWSRMTPLRRVGVPQDIADAVLFLASEQASFITGQTLNVDGGVFCQAPWPDYG
ncbi:SDR family NAD(P)-dependent oxidoreductase [Roseibium sp.]|uniref:SDR family NAD(P)-dependent oxidoreductase n=1 Tax=Roseibium sp. TaxID=1936156 RepID=UPI003A973C66